ncbi:UvrD-helicase domain-containing protein [Desulfovibrio cuneatus]|uniref:UvrD-helicase domain-containing protein n=1 Tax=Desulfovibrio cuneatus TaxID=159728 RepID=UPI0003F6A7D5|nr:UvrD-helicase domain-containing protein [Desulfovibrio cuneatus]
MILQISASAGSGKTYTLTRQFLSRLAGASPLPAPSGCLLGRPHTVYSLEELLAATFTNKAAAEMKERVVGTLKSLALEEIRARQQGHSPQGTPLVPNAERWVRAIVENYNALNIRTIDSLLSSLVRLSALSLNLPPDFRPSFAPEEYFTPLYEGLMADMAAFAQANPDWRNAEDTGNHSTEDVTAPPHGEEQVQKQPGAEDTPSQPEFFTTSGAELLEALHAACRNQIFYGKKRGFMARNTLHYTLLQFIDRRCKGQALPTMQPEELLQLLHARHTALQQCAATMNAGVASEELAAKVDFLKFLAKVAAIPAHLPPPTSAFANKECLDACLKKASLGKASPALEEEYHALCAAHAAAVTAQGVLSKAMRLAPLSLLANELFARLDTAVRLQGVLPAVAIPALAGQLLEGSMGVSDALCRLGSRLLHILLDEFQDTSQEQWAALLPLAEESLAKGGSLTYVGDIKQAIYSWRGGDATLFDAVLEEPTLAAMAESVAESLPYNWRSLPGIIHHNNAFFTLLGTPEAAQATLQAMLPAATPIHFVVEAAKRTAAVFSRAAQALPPPSPYSNAATADQNPANQGQTDQGQVVLYEVRASTGLGTEALVEERLHRLLLEELLPNRPFRDIAILVRSGKHATLVAQWLTTWNIPVVTENSFTLGENPLVRRLVSLLTFLDYPLNDLAFWEFISGPECFGTVSGLGWQELADWLARTSMGETRPPLFRRFAESFPQQWNTWLAPFYLQAGLMSAYDTLYEAISRFDLWNTTPEAAPFLRRLLELAHVAEKEGAASLAGFLQFWQKQEEGAKLPLPESMNAVRIMTMHKAKGLEFPVVILPFHHGGTAYGSQLEAVTFEGTPILVQADKHLPDTYYPACVTEALETLNLLYVAWTRPREELHAFITLPEGKAGSTPLPRAMETLLPLYLHSAQAHLFRHEQIEAEADTLDAEDAEEGEESAMAGEAIPGGKEPESAMPAEPFPPEEECEDPCLASTSPQWLTGLLAEAPHAPLLPIIPEDSAQGQEAWRPMGWLPRLKIYRSVLHGAALTPERRGTLTHLCLEHLVLEKATKTQPVEAAMPLLSLAKPAPAPATSPFGKAVTLAVDMALRLFPLPLALPPEARAELEETLHWFAGQPQAQHWLAHGRREQPLMEADGSVLRVDLMVDEGRTGLLVVDYKTGAPSPKYHEQMQRYMRLLAQAQNRPVRGLLVYLDARRLEEVPL